MTVITTNKRAYFDYLVLETFDAGIELKGFEAKAVKAGKISLAGSFVVIRGGEAWLLNVDIPPYQAGNIPEKYDSKRSRRLLLTKEQLKTLYGKSEEEGLTIIPLKVYIKNRLIKLEIGVCRGKKKHDKRQKIKEWEWKRLRRKVATK